MLKDIGESISEKLYQNMIVLRIAQARVDIVMQTASVTYITHTVRKGVVNYHIISFFSVDDT